MPIEIKELHIKINVDETQRENKTGRLSQGAKEQLIAACVEQVMDILSKKEER